MVTVFDKYHDLYMQLKELEQSVAQSKMLQQAAIQSAEEEIEQINSQCRSKLQELEAVEVTVTRYASDAKRFANVSSELCPPLKPDLGDLQRYHTVIATQNQGDFHRRKYAEELLKKCWSAIKFLDKEKKQINEQMQTARQSLFASQTILHCREQTTQLEARIEQELLPNMANLLNSAESLADKYHINEQEVYAPALPKASPSEMCLGYAEFSYIQSELQKAFSQKQSRLHKKYGTHIPFGLLADGQNEEGMYTAKSVHIWYNEETCDSVHKIIQSITFNILRNYPTLCGRITYLDFATFNDEYLKSMRCFAEENSLIQFPHHENQVKACLSKLNAASAMESENERQRRFLIIKDASNNGAGGQFSETFASIVNNASRNNITTIHVNFLPDTDKISIFPGQVHIRAKGSRFYLSLPDTEYPFYWFHAPSKLDKNTIQVFQDKLIPKKISNEYENFFPLQDQINYVRDRRPIKLPYGMDHKGNIQYMTLEGMEFASFVMGASGSGKSTLLHALIAGIIRNYHPDEVELWLADLKLMEFANYTHHMPPHVKYILMDSSKELVHDFIDLLHAEMERRQGLLAAYGTNDCKNLPRDKYMPALVVIIDEFSTLSDVIRDDDTYKRKLEQILVRGRGPGLRLIFSSQSYKDGAPALTALAKDQIQTRIAMKNTPEEIKLTMALPSSEMTDAILHDINTLPEHYALRCVQEKSGLHRVDKTHGLYFNGRDEEGWKSRFELIDRLNKTMRPVPLSEFDPDKIDQYVEKKPIIVSSKSLQAFSEESFRREVKLYSQEPDNMVFDEDILVRFGQPRKLVNNLFTVVTEENSENIFLLAGNREITCGMSVIMSAVRSFRYHGGDIQFWAHPRNRTYHFFKDTHLSAYPVHVGAESIREAIDNLRIKIQTRRKGNELIVLLGMDSICADLNDSTDDGFSVSVPAEVSAVDLLFGSQPKEQSDISGILPVMAPATEAFPIVQSEKTAQNADTTALEAQIKDSLVELDALYDKFYDEQSALGKTDDEIDEAFDIFYAEYRAKKYGAMVKDAAKMTGTVPNAAAYIMAPVTETFPVVQVAKADRDSDTTELEDRISKSLADQEELYEKFYDEQSALGKTDDEIDEAFDVFYAEYSKKKYGIAITNKHEKTQDIPSVICPQTSKDYLKDFQQLIRVGSRYGYHFLICVSNFQSLKTMGLGISLFNHRLSFKTDSTDTSASIFNNNTSAYRLPEHTCYYSAYGTTSANYAITPYLHPGITWNNWTVDENGIARDDSRL